MSNLKNLIFSIGNGVNEEIPYAYVGKRYDAFSGLIYFGKRFYDPNLGRWLTPDPLGAVDHSNLYQYVFNNPFKYYDPNGEFVFAIPLLFWGTGLALPTISACITAVTYTAVAGVVAYGGYKAIEAINKNTDVYNQDIKVPNISWKKATKKPPRFNGKGKPGTGKGSWVKGQRGSQEILYPDLDHPPPVGPHWDYESPDFPEGVRIFPNGTWSPK